MGGPGSGAFFRLGVCALLALAMPFSAWGRERLVARHLDWQDGFPTPEVVAVAQDATGFIWIGTTGGLVRYDGDELLHWAPQALPDAVTLLACSPSGETLLVHGPARELYRVADSGVESVRRPDGARLTDVRSVVFDSDDTLWVAHGERTLLRRDPGGNWSSLEPLPSPSEVIGIRPRGTAPGIYVATRDGLWQVDASGDARRLGKFAGLQDVIDLADGSLILTANSGGAGRVMQFRAGRVRELFRSPERVLTMVLRGPVVWVGYDLYVVALRPGEPPEVVGREDGLSSGGPLLVDREGSLWVGTLAGLVQFQEPETWVWSDRQGLASLTPRFLTRTPDTVWIGLWSGMAKLSRHGAAWQFEKEATSASGLCCADPWGGVWMADVDALHARRGARLESHPAPGVGAIEACAPGKGRLWLGTQRGLFLKDGAQGPPVAKPGPSPAPGWAGRRALIEDDQERLWMPAGDRRVCFAPAAAVAAGQRVSWSCDELNEDPFDVVQLPGGELWLAVAPSGDVLRRVEDRWEVIPASRRLPSRGLRGLASSPSGGVWVFGDGFIQRVAGRRDLPEGWEVLERVSVRHGLPANRADDLLEDPDGTVWIANPGITRVPPEVRRQAIDLPRVELVDVRVDGRHQPTDRRLRLPFGRNRIELRFAALSYKDPLALRYRIRLAHDAPWSDPIRKPVFHFVELVPGRYEAEVAATLDGDNWSPRVARFAFTVRQPWFLQGWFLVPAAVVLVGTLLSLHRARVRSLLRLESQRSRIAMDLHDEVGSGLGSIAILADLVGRPTVREARRRELATQVAKLAGELGSALTEIVWSLGRGPSTVESLAIHLVESATNLLPGPTPSLSTDFPATWPEVSLSAAARRSVLLIALEALHNAARHAGAKEVVLGLAPAGRRWRLWVADDGRGIEDEVESGLTARSGMGLVNMRRRAEEIGAEIVWSRSGGGGTVVSVIFHPHAGERLRAARDVSI